jgi:hypothetical protein
MKPPRLFASAALILALAAPAFAQSPDRHVHGEGIHFDTDVTVKLGADRVYNSTNAPSKLVDGYAEFEGVTKLFVTSNFNLQAKLHWERVKAPTENRLFGGHAAYLENLFANLELDVAKLYAGKFNPAFGMGWDDARLPGFYANEFAKDYQMKEAIGAGAGREFDLGAIGTHKIDATAFFFDNTSLSRSAFNRPGYGPGQGPLSTTLRLGQNRLAYGGPGNTDGPESFALNYELSDPKGLEGLTIGLGYRRLAAGDRQPTSLQAGSGPVASRASDGYVAGARYEIGLPAGFVFTPFVEWAKFTDVFNSDPNIGVNQFKDRSYWTTAGILTWGDFTFVASRMTRTFAKPDGVATSGDFYNQQDRQIAANLLYKVMEDLTVGIGWKRTKAVPAFGNVNAQANTSAIGAQAVYSFEF